MSLDTDILKHHGGFESNSLTNIIETDSNLDGEIQIIKHSPYYDYDGLCTLLRDKTDVFTILVQIYSPYGLNSVNLRFS